MTPNTTVPNNNTLHPIDIAIIEMGSFLITELLACISGYITHSFTDYQKALPNCLTHQSDPNYQIQRQVISNIAMHFLCTAAALRYFYVNQHKKTQAANDDRNNSNESSNDSSYKKFILKFTICLSAISVFSFSNILFANTPLVAHTLLQDPLTCILPITSLLPIAALTTLTQTALLFSFIGLISACALRPHSDQQETSSSSSTFRQPNRQPSDTARESLLPLRM